MTTKRRKTNKRRILITQGFCLEAWRRKGRPKQSRIGSGNQGGRHHSSVRLGWLHFVEQRPGKEVARKRKSIRNILEFVAKF